MIFRKTGIQLKRYSSAVGNFAVQEAVAGKKFYKLDKVCVLTNSFFTKSAKELAKVNGVELLDRNDLKALIQKAKSARIFLLCFLPSLKPPPKNQTPKQSFFIYII